MVWAWARPDAQYGQELPDPDYVCNLARSMHDRVETVIGAEAWHLYARFKCSFLLLRSPELLLQSFVGISVATLAVLIPHLTLPVR